MYMKKRCFYKRILILFILFQSLQVCLFRLPKLVYSSPLTSASDTLSNYRLSFYGKVSGNYDIGARSFTLEPSNNPDNANLLFVRDTVSIGSNNNQTVASVAGTLAFTTTAGITNPLANGNVVYSPQFARHTIAFTTASTIVNGAIGVLIQAGDSTSASNDSLPDGGTTAGFDMNKITGSNVTCPTGGNVIWAPATATPSISFSHNLHAFECQFTGSLVASTPLTMIIGGTTTTTQLINPGPKTNHTQGTADNYIVKIQELQRPAFNSVDSVSVVISPVEAVMVSAKIKPSLKIGGEIQFILFGYTSPKGLVTLNGMGIFEQTYADDKGYFQFNRRYSTLSSREACLTTQDQLGRVSSPVCLPPFPLNNDINIGPVIVPPTISLDKNYYYSGDEVILSGQTIPNIEVLFSTFIDEKKSLFPVVYAYTFPELTTKADNKGNFSLSLPSSSPQFFRLFAQANYKDGISPESIRLNLSILPIWMIVVQFFLWLLSLLRPRFLEIVALCEVILLLIYFLRRYLHPYVIARNRTLAIRQHYPIVEEELSIVEREEHPLIKLS